MAERIKNGIAGATKTVQGKRENLRNRISQYDGAEQAIHLLISVVLAINTVLMLFTLIHVIGWLLIAGLPLLDSLPLVLYVVPLLIILPSLVYSYYTSRSANVNLIVTIIELVIFALLTNLVRGFLILISLNMVAVLFMLVYGRFGFQGSLKDLGKKGIAWFIFMNLLGLAMPIATHAMGRNPIASVSASDTVPLRFSVSVDENVSSLQSHLDSIQSNDFSLDLKVQTGAMNWYQRTINWLNLLNTTDMNHSITLSANREYYFQLSNHEFGSAQLLDLVFENYYTVLNETFHRIDFTSAYRKPNIIYLDMKVSSSEWSLLFSSIRAVDFGAFSGIIRSMLESSNRSIIQEWTSKLTSLAESFGVSLGLVVEPFVMDDSMDGDDNTMRVCGLISDTLSCWDSIDVSCNRTLFSKAMTGDVGEYFLYSYSRTLPSITYFDSIRVSESGKDPYSQMEILANDIVIASSGTPRWITVESLTSIVSSFGENAVQDLSEGISSIQEVSVTYTFRIFAFRVVFLAIDAFDPIFF
ncbi:MAG: hypothetical protein GF309_13900 [Candidatus Lokiarchaeota archaeon]|nr:hypothetical protein [Candidatus Lokiarchaeota archaeon]